MGTFSGNVTATKVGDNSWELREKLSYQNDQYKITAKEGLVTDFASIPRIAWTLVGSPAMGKYTASSVIHDILYATEALPRKEADELFLEMLEEDGVGWIKRYTMYWAVRAGGWAVWKGHTKESIQEAQKYIKLKKES